MRLILFVFLYISLHTAEAQTWVKQWDKQYGGNRGVNFHTFMQTADKGYLLGCVVFSDTTSDISEPSRDTTFQPRGDWWFIKVDEDGNKQWDKRLGGGEREYLYTAIQSNDGGYMLGGYSESRAGGDKTNDNWLSDYWLVKLDAQGNKLWDRTYGGSSGEELTSIVQINDSYLLAGTASSGISGDKTDTSRGERDYWVIKIDAAGNKIWDKTYGSAKSDYLNVALMAKDGGFILAGNTIGGISGDKTQANWDSAGSTTDMWVVKTDSLGNKQWDKRYGGINTDAVVAAVQANDSGYLLVGISSSPISGDKSQNPWGANPNNYQLDYWVLKIDMMGARQWDKRYGSVYPDYARSIISAKEGGYILSGVSSSPLASGDKSENNIGHSQSWIIKTNDVGEVLWDKTIFTAGGTSISPDGRIAETEDGCYIVANCNNADTGGYKSQARWGVPTPYTNLWLVKLCMNTETGSPYLGQSDHWQLYPNPTTGKLTIQTPAASYSFQILATDGRVLMQNPVKQQTNLDIDVSTLPAGLYFLQLWDGTQQVAKKFMKQ